MICTYAKLKGKIKEVCNTQEEFAKAVGISSATMSSRLNGKSDWLQSEIRKAVLILQIPVESIGEYFFAQ